MLPVTYAWASERRYRTPCIQFVKRCRERHGIQEIREITPEMVSEYIDEREAAGLSPRTIATEITAPRRLGMYAVMDEWIEQNLVPNDLSMPHGSRPRYS